MHAAASADPHVVSKIRKLLRLASTEGPEGENAKARAAELMEKHQIKVKLEDANHRHIVDNVSGELWREQLLLAVALTHNCKLMVGTERAGSEHGRAAVIGEKPNVEAAVAHYLRMQVGLVMRCQRDWQRFIDQTIPRTSGHLDHAFRMNEIISVWSRLYLVSAAQTVAARMQLARASTPAAVTPVPTPAAPTTEPSSEPEAAPSVSERVAESRQVDEEETILQEMSVLERLMGLDRSMRLQQTAWACGEIVGNGVSIVDDGSGAMGEERQLA